MLFNSASVFLLLIFLRMYIVFLHSCYHYLVNKHVYKWRVWTVVLYKYVENQLVRQLTNRDVLRKTKQESPHFTNNTVLRKLKYTGHVWRGSSGSSAFAVGREVWRKESKSRPGKDTEWWPAAIVWLELLHRYCEIFNYSFEWWQKCENRFGFSKQLPPWVGGIFL